MTVLLSSGTYIAQLATFRREGFFVRRVMYVRHKDHDIQLAPARIGPLTQFSWTELLLFKWMGAPFQLWTSGPLYRVMVMTPANDIKVPTTLAIPRAFLTSRASNLHKILIKWCSCSLHFLIKRRETCSRSVKPHLSATAITKVNDATTLIMDVPKVGEVHSKLAKYMLRVKLTLFNIREKKTVSAFY